MRAIAPQKTVDFGPSSANMVAFDPPGMFSFFVSDAVDENYGVTSWFLISVKHYKYKVAHKLHCGPLLAGKAKYFTRACLRCIEILQIYWRV